MYGGASATPGNIIVRQKGTKFNPGNGVAMGKDFTLFALQEGKVNFKTLKGKKYVEVIHG